MRKTLEKALVVALALTGLAACSADVGDSTDTLRAVDEDAMIGQLLFLQPELTPFPMTAAELEASGTDTTQAIPVRVEIFDELAVAWFAPEGVARVNRDGIVAVWNVVERTPIDGALENNAEIGVVEPGDRPIFIGDRITQPTGPELPTDQVDPDLPRDYVTRTILDFADIVQYEDELAVLAQLSGFHPGCL